MERAERIEQQFAKLAVQVRHDIQLSRAEKSELCARIGIAREQTLELTKITETFERLADVMYRVYARELARAGTPDEDTAPGGLTKAEEVDIAQRMAADPVFFDAVMDDIHREPGELAKLPDLLDLTDRLWRSPQSLDRVLARVSQITAEKKAQTAAAELEPRKLKPCHAGGNSSYPYPGHQWNADFKRCDICGLHWEDRLADEERGAHA